jgi:hypothetical protein
MVVVVVEDVVGTRSSPVVGTVLDADTATAPNSPAMSCRLVISLTTGKP